jgi:putative transposase
MSSSSVWRSLKYACVYRQAFETPRQAHQQSGDWIVYYNHQRLHCSLKDRRPDEALRGITPLAQAA